MCLLIATDQSTASYHFNGWWMSFNSYLLWKEKCNQMTNNKIPCATKEIEPIIDEAAALSSACARALTFWRNNSPTTVSCTHENIASFSRQRNYIRIYTNEVQIYLRTSSITQPMTELIRKWKANTEAQCNTWEQYVETATQHLPGLNLYMSSKCKSWMLL